MSQLNNTDLIECQAALKSIAQTVQIAEGNLGSAKGDHKVSPAETALQRLDQTRISLGNPRDNLVRLTPRLFTAINVELDPIQKAMLAGNNFYYMTVAVSMIPGNGVQFSQLKLELDFEPKGSNEPLVHSMFPTAAWKDVITYGAGLSLGLNARLQWSAGLDSDKAAEALKQAHVNLPGEVSANVSNKNKYSAFITIPDFSYNMGRAEIEAAGEGNSFCYWLFEKPELKESQNVKFGMVFKTPKKVKKVNLTGKIKAQTSMPWLTANLRAVFNALNPNQQNAIRSGLVLGDYKEWEVSLPA